MKKNTLTIIVILAVIALLHFVFIYFFFVRSSGNSQPLPANVPEPTIMPPSGNVQNNDGPAVGSGPSKKKPHHRVKGSVTHTA